MPTSGSARFSSPLNVTDFIKIISLVGLNQTTASYLVHKQKSLPVLKD
jgi:histidinol dehydrogenase